MCEIIAELPHETKCNVFFRIWLGFRAEACYTGHRKREECAYVYFIAAK